MPKHSIALGNTNPLSTLARHAAPQSHDSQPDRVRKLQKAAVRQHARRAEARYDNLPVFWPHTREKEVCRERWWSKESMENMFTLRGSPSPGDTLSSIEPPPRLGSTKGTALVDLAANELARAPWRHSRDTKRR